MKLITFTLEDTMLAEKFRELAIDLYKNQGQYAAQANRINTALFVRGYMMMENDEVCARVILFKPNLKLNMQDVLFFGNFEAIDHVLGAQLLNALLRNVEENYPKITLIGPVNGTTWNDYRISIDHQDILFPNDISSPSFYHLLFLESGFEVFAKYHTNLQTGVSSGKAFHSGELSVVFLTKELFREKLSEICQLTMQAFSKSPLFTPLTEMEFIEKQLQLLPLLDMDLLPFVLDKQGHIAGYAFCYYGFDKDSLVVKTIARKAGREYAGIGRMLSEAIIQIAKKKNIQKIFHAFMHEQNTSNILSGNLDGKRVKEYALYILKKSK